MRKLAIALLFLSTPCYARSGADAVATELARSREAASKLPDAIFTAEERSSVNQQHTSLDELVRAGRVPAALLGLLRVSRYVDAQAFRAKSAAGIKEGLAALGRDWEANGVERRGQTAAYEKASHTEGPAVARALSESAFYESRIVYEASRAYGEQVGAEYGYFYLGEARALMNFALFCRGLPVEGGKLLPNLKPLGPLMAELEQELLDAYGRDTASPQQTAFARANGALKLARELDRERSAFGAFYQCLLAAQALGQSRAGDAVPNAASLRAAADDLERRLSAGKVDHTLGLAFVQLAQSGIERAHAASDPKPTLLNAQALIERVLPVYLKVVGE